MPQNRPLIEANKQNQSLDMFLELLDQFGLKQSVDTSTHKHGHTLDLVIARQSDVLITSPQVSFQLPSDHAVLTYTIEIPRLRPVKVLVNYRKLRSVNTKNLESDIQNSLLVAAPKVTLDELVEQYNATLKSIVDVHAPVKTRWLTIRPHAPWYNDELRAEKREKRRKERRWRCTRLEVDKQIFQDHCSKYQDLVKRCKTNYHKDHISRCDNRMLFAEVDKLANGLLDQLFLLSPLLMS
ncbi:uncharacterized protein LOC114576505 [Exaiptasia diaphana]|uniref:Uncharacterized protein n=1 Tax=Exaiptasia diaphana TaxID=2652724 RepID=A0A913YY85_EXADI|nr:uncharacterized protein LOC114576505 [Exaiptasia diaphana]